MAQITGPVIAISLVLLSVFVPIAFIPGVSGTLFRQFAVTISVAMLISAVNALTFRRRCARCSCAIRQATRPDGWMLRGIDGAATAMRAIVRRVVAGVRAVAGAGRALPAAGSGFWQTDADRLPARGRPGRFFVAVQLPDGPRFRAPASGAAGRSR